MEFGYPLRIRREKEPMTKPLSFEVSPAMITDGKGVVDVIVNGGIIFRTGNTAGGVSLRSGSITALKQAAKRLEATAAAMMDKAAQIEKYGLDTAE